MVQLAKQQLCTRSTLFLYISLPLFCTTITWNFQKLPTYTFYGRNVLRVLVHLFSLIFFTTAHFHLRGRKHYPFSHCRYKIFVFLPTKNVSLVFYLFRSFARWASLACRLLSLFLCLSLSLYSKFVDMTIKSKPNVLDNTDTETISAFPFRLYWLFSCLCFTRHGWLCEKHPRWKRNRRLTAMELMASTPGLETRPDL